MATKEDVFTRGKAIERRKSCTSRTAAQAWRWGGAAAESCKCTGHPQSVCVQACPGRGMRQELRKAQLYIHGGAAKLPRPGFACIQQQAVCASRYAEAAELREKLREAKERTDAALGRRSAAAEAVAPRRFRLGQRVTHAVHGYRGVICGRAAQLRESMLGMGLLPAVPTLCLLWAPGLALERPSREGRA